MKWKTIFCCQKCQKSSKSVKITVLKVRLYFIFFTFKNDKLIHILWIKEQINFFVKNFISDEIIKQYHIRVTCTS